MTVDRLDAPSTSHPAERRAPSMLAVAQSRYGTPEVLVAAHVERPEPGRGEVLVRVFAASVNARDWHVMQGEPRLARLLDRSLFGLRRPRAAVRGTDLAGVVEAVGPDVAGWRPGDAVFGEGTGSFAEYAVARADQLAAIPDGVSFERAAALPLAATTALLCLTVAPSAPGNRVLVNGASGGVGTFALQLARSMGLWATAVVSSRNADLARRLGAERVVDYTVEDFTDRAEQYDLVVDLVGNRRLRDLRRAVRPGGSLVLSGGGVPGRGRFLGPLGLLLRAAVGARFLGLDVRVPQARPDAAVLADIARLVAAEQITPVIDRTFALADAPAAMDYVVHEHPRAKVVITVGVEAPGHPREA